MMPCSTDDCLGASSKPNGSEISRRPSQLITSFQEKCLRTYLRREPLRKSLTGSGFCPPRPKGRSPIQKALVIGMNCARLGEDKRLKFAANDAERFTRCLTDQLGFDPRNIHTVTDTSPENEALPLPLTTITKELGWLFEGAQNGDTLVLFSHCQYNETNKVVSLVSVEERTTPRLIPSTVFRSYFDKLPPGCTVEIVLDCCYGAGLIKLPNLVGKMEMDDGKSANVLNMTNAMLSTSRSDYATPGTSQGASNYPNSRGVANQVVAQPVEPKPQANGATSNGTTQRSTHDSPEPLRRESHPRQPVVSGSPPLSGNPSARVIAPPGPDFLAAPVDTPADVTLWAASGPEQRAFESSDVEEEPTNGILTHAICKVLGT
ncbi:hypothetical protein FRC12_000852 [Ceratobasidium sp. 428]|nr:hypothetical protein FRC12_000852 [Ceratobasidium sp. 428]